MVLSLAFYTGSSANPRLRLVNINQGLHCAPHLHPLSRSAAELSPSASSQILTLSLCAMKMASSSSFVFFFVLLCLASQPLYSHSESIQLEDINATAESNASRARSQDSFADMIDRALEKEFTENEQTGGEQI